MTNFEIRAKARKDLGGKIFDTKWMMALVAGLIYSLIATVLAAIPAIGSIALLVITGPLVFGFNLYFINLAREKTPAFDNLFEGFKKDFLQNFLIALMTGIFTFLWSLLLIIPGIIKSFSYSMAMYIKNDNPTYDWKTCIDESKKRMNGKKMQLFCLYLSFIGWMIVCSLTFGIGYLWLLPYMQAAMTNFYEANIKVAEPVFEEPAEIAEPAAEVAEEPAAEAAEEPAAEAAEEPAAEVAEEPAAEAAEEPAAESTDAEN